MLDFLGVLIKDTQLRDRKKIKKIPGPGGSQTRDLALKACADVWESPHTDRRPGRPLRGTGLSCMMQQFIRLNFISDRSCKLVPEVYRVGDRGPACQCQAAVAQHIACSTRTHPLLSTSHTPRTCCVQAFMVSTASANWNVLSLSQLNLKLS